MIIYTIFSFIFIILMFSYLYLFIKHFFKNNRNIHNYTSINKLNHYLYNDDYIHTDSE